MKRLLFPALLSVLWLLASSSPAQERNDGQAGIPQLVPKVFTTEVSTESTKESNGTLSPFPGLAEVVPRTADLSQRAIRAEETIGSLGDASAYGKQISEAENRLTQLGKRIAGTGDPASWNIYRLIEIQQLVLNEKQRIEALLDAISPKLSELETIGKKWSEEHLFWKKWEESLREAQTEIPLENFRKVHETVAAVVRSVSNASQPLLVLQQRLTKLLDELNQLNTPVEAALRKVHSETFQKNTPSFFSVEFYQQFNQALWVTMRQRLVESLRLEWEYLPNYGRMLLVQFLATIALISLLQRRRRLSEKTEEWHFVWQHPYAFSIFAVQSLALLLYTGQALSWTFLNLILVYFSTSFLMSAILPHRRMGRVLFFVAGILTITSSLKLVSLPPPLFSLALAVVGMVGIWFFVGQAKRYLAEQNGKLDLFSVGLRSGPLVLGAALLLLMAGYSNLAHYLVRSAGGSIFLCTICYLLLHLGNGGIEMLLRQPLVARLGLISRFGEAIETRLKKLLKAGLLFLLLLVLFQLWGIYPSFGQAWQKIFDFRFAIGDLTLSLGRILLSVFLVYVVVSGSWFIRAFLEGEVFPRRQLDRGASDAINKLIHYSFLFVGIMLAISLIGLNLTSFAFLTGAVGIGVGFGLQNIVNNFVSGLMLLFERPFKVGDMVVVDNETGTVRRIGLRSTIIETFDRSELIVPNSQFISGKVTNWTRSSQFARIRIPVGVAYGSDIQLVLRLLKEAAETDRRILRDPPPNPLFLRFGDNALEFELHAWIADVKERLAVTSHLCQEIAARFDEATVEIPYPQRDLHLRSIDEALLERAFRLRQKETCEG